MERKEALSGGKETGLWRQNNPAAQAAFDDSPSFVFTFLFALLPIWGMATAFFLTQPGPWIPGSEFVGLRHFSRFFFQTVILEIFCATPWRSVF